MYSCSSLHPGCASMPTCSSSLALAGPKPPLPNVTNVTHLQKKDMDMGAKLFLSETPTPNKHLLHKSQHGRSSPTPHQEKRSSPGSTQRCLLTQGSRREARGTYFMFFQQFLQGRQVIAQGEAFHLLNALFREGQPARELLQLLLLQFHQRIMQPGQGGQNIIPSGLFPGMGTYSRHQGSGGRKTHPCLP